jgi:hypothetical protein
MLIEYPHNLWTEVEWAESFVPGELLEYLHNHPQEPWMPEGLPAEDLVMVQVRKG